MPHLRPIDSESADTAEHTPAPPPQQPAQPAQPSGGGSQDLADILVDACVKFFSSADDVLSRRLAASHTVVHIHLHDADDHGFTVFFDEHPAHAESGYVGNAECQIYCTTDQWMKVILGQEHLGLQIIKGNIEYEGPVRKFLRATPMMRRLDVDHLRPIAAAARERRQRENPSDGGQA
jgi:hypothetical protein